MRVPSETSFARLPKRVFYTLAVLCAVLLKPANCDDLNLKRFYEPNRCGPIALYCVCKSCKIDATIDELATLAGFDGRETSVAGLVAAAEKKGLKAEAFESTMAHLTTLGGPAIIDYPKGHFCAFYGWKGTSAVVLDPPKKTELVSFGELRRRWGRHVVTFTVAETRGIKAAPGRGDHSEADAAKARKAAQSARQ